MCGSPWIVGDCPEEEWLYLLAGVHTGGGIVGSEEYMGIFIGANVLIERLIEIQ
jgi:hypothetical protein